MTLYRPSFKALHTLEVVCRRQSMSGAADELHITPAAVSQQLKSLGEGFGVAPVVKREGRVYPSPMVERGLGELREGFRRIDAALTLMHEHQSGRSLTVTVEPSFAAAWLIRRLFRFTDRHPDIALRLDASTAIVDLAIQDVSVAIRFGSGHFPGLRAEKLLSEEVLPVCSPSLLERHHPLRTPRDLRWQTLVHDDTATADVSWVRWDNWLRRVGCEVKPAGNVHFAQSNLAIEAAVEGQGVALVGKVMVADHLASGKLVTPFGDSSSQPTEYAYYVVTLPTRMDQSEVVAFCEWILAEASSSA